jgi:hypothetical protein
MDFEIPKTLYTSPSKTFEQKIIIERTPTTLKLEAKRNRVFLRILMGGIPFILFLLVMLIYTPKRTTLTTLKCDRLNQTKLACELIYSSLLEEHITPIPVEDFQGAKLKANKKGTSYGITLLTNKEDIPLSGMSSSSENVAQKKVNKINDFISNSEQMSLRIHQDNRWSVYASLGISARSVSGVFFSSLISKLDITCIFDKEADRMYLKRQNLFKNAEIREEILYEIREAKRVEKTDKKGNQTYNIKLILRSDDEITLFPLALSYNPYKITQSINHFLEHQSRKKS